MGAHLLKCMRISASADVAAAAAAPGAMLPIAAGKDLLPHTIGFIAGHTPFLPGNVNKGRRNYLPLHS